MWRREAELFVVVVGWAVMDLTVGLIMTVEVVDNTVDL